MNILKCVQTVHLQEAGPGFHLVGGLAQSCGVSVVKRPPSSPSSVWPCCLQVWEGSHPYKDLQSSPKSRPQLTPGHKSKGNSSSSSKKLIPFSVKALEAVGLGRMESKSEAD